MLASTRVTLPRPETMAPAILCIADVQQSQWIDLGEDPAPEAVAANGHSGCPFASQPVPTKQLAPARPQPLMGREKELWYRPLVAPSETGFNWPHAPKVLPALS